MRAGTRTGRSSIFCVATGNVPGDFNVAAAVPAWSVLVGMLFHLTGVSLVAVRALAVTLFCCKPGTLLSAGERSRAAMGRAIVCFADCQQFVSFLPVQAGHRRAAPDFPYAVVPDAGYARKAGKIFRRGTHGAAVLRDGFNEDDSDILVACNLICALVSVAPTVPGFS